MAFGFGPGRAARLPVDHVETVVLRVGEHRVDPAADQPVTDERLERHLYRPRPAIGPLAPLEARAELGEITLVPVAGRVVIVGPEQDAVVDEQLLAVPLFQPPVKGGASAGLPGRRAGHGAAHLPS